MPRPQRDYNVALKMDIEKIDRRLEALLIERERKTRMLQALNAPVRVDVAAFVASRTGGATTGRKRRS